MVSKEQQKEEIEKLKRELDYYFDKSNSLLSDIMEIGKMLNLEPGTITYMKDQIREKYCPLEKENERLQSNIKDIRAIIEDITSNYFKRYNKKVYELCDDILEILDKGE